jgi:arginine decarboxylase
VRVKLASIAKGKWQDSGGEKSKFGLNSTQVLAIVSRIKAIGFSDALQLMHFHIGSQVSNIYDIQKGVHEAGRYYAELRSLGVPIHTVDVGGGLGVDYEGMQSRGSFSVNYSIHEYANNIIDEFDEICKKLDLPKPHIITETGRAITAHHALLITDIIDVEPIINPVEIQPAIATDPDIIQALWCQLNDINPHSASEIYHNAKYWLNEIHSMFAYGVITLQQRAHAEQLYYAICSQIRTLIQKDQHTRACREMLDELNEKLVDKYFVNFSLFRSVPDAWAIDQLVPIVPLHRLDEYPDRRATLQDLTCDSDGQFKHYVSNEWIDSNLPMHALLPEQPYLIGIFLVGAYQETLGDMHNLFGNTDTVNVHIHPHGHYTIQAIKQGDSIADMLNCVGFDTQQLLSAYQKNLQQADLESAQQQAYFQALKIGLKNNTYLSR